MKPARTIGAGFLGMLASTAFVSCGTVARYAEGEEVIPVRAVFVEIGLVPNSEFARGFLELNPAGEIIVDCACRTNVPGVFAAGDVTTVPEKQIIIAAGEGAKAALVAYRWLIANGKI